MVSDVFSFVSNVFISILSSVSSVSKISVLGIVDILSNSSFCK